MLKKHSTSTISLWMLLLLAACSGQQQGNDPQRDTLLNPSKETSTANVAVATSVAIPQPTLEPYCREIEGAAVGIRVCNEFLTFWEQGGGLTRYGPPMTEPFYEIADDGTTYLAQYFANAPIILERPAPGDYSDWRYKQVHRHIGMEIYNRKYPEGAPEQRPSTDPNGVIAGKYRMGGPFRNFTGYPPNPLFLDAIEMYGVPISDPFVEKNEIDGKLYTVQYFEDAALEFHPEIAPPNDVIFVPLGRYEFNYRYPNGVPNNPTPTPRPYITPQAGYGCWRNAELEDASGKPNIELAEAEQIARKHYADMRPSPGYTESLGELRLSRYVRVDITGPQADVAIYRDAWHLMFLKVLDNPSPDHAQGYNVFIDGESGEILPGCENLWAADYQQN